MACKGACLAVPVLLLALGGDNLKTRRRGLRLRLRLRLRSLTIVSCNGDCLAERVLWGLVHGLSLRPRLRLRLRLRH